MHSRLGLRLASSVVRAAGPLGTQAQKRSVAFSHGKKGLQELLHRNKEWASNVKKDDPTYFSKLADTQTPEVLWIGCSDSRVPANQILDLPPGEVFVHRNIANQFLSTDLNALSVLEYAVNVLKVKHVIVCGHYGCGGVNAALSQQEFGLVDNWLRSIKDIYSDNTAVFERLSDDKKKSDLLTELNVAKSVYNVCHTRIVQNAWQRDQELQVHGWCYRLKDGIIRDLKICISGEEQVEAIYRKMMEKTTPEL
ncbi:carbonic anhydrase [Saprolegnia diclina VS20]|uniref:Carbonic anhydrase n=1 Tax=Saprolegnia diclina (strain VS20) TaxID=1156394 RepID=T0S9F3_SAPDV|nr:carbonic anhydrase [Saprolegnia diclina VS20]EQC39342.1 carbonic anhydrase [Saprolegnia diclina VS20]|eukprot:XP_008607403.1 carbonic anhydrase [Saprolegnia diclina VS20]